MKKDNAKFAIDKSPFSFWDPDIVKRNRDYINQIDVDFFESMAELNFQNLCATDENKEENKKLRQYLAIALRMAYSQGLETFFSLVCATIQSPDCVFGWSLKYSNANLKSVINKISKYENIYTKFDVPGISWRNITELIFSGGKEDQRHSEGVEDFCQLWTNFAQDFLDDKFQYEYNNFKHGLRIHMGGFGMAIGPQNVESEIAKPEEMHWFANSEFGSTFLVPVSIKKSKNYCLETWSRNWSPESMYWGVKLITLSLKNVLFYLKMINGMDIVNQNYMTLNDRNNFSKPWENGFMSSGFNQKPNLEAIPILSDKDILSVYNTSKK